LGKEEFSIACRPDISIALRPDISIVVQQILSGRFRGGLLEGDRWSRRRSREGLFLESFQFLQFFGAGLALSGLAAKFRQAREPPLGLRGPIFVLVDLSLALHPGVVGLCKGEEMLPIWAGDDHFAARQVEANAQPRTDETIRRGNGLQHIPTAKKDLEMVTVRVVHAVF